MNVPNALGSSLEDTAGLEWGEGTSHSGWTRVGPDKSLRAKTGVPEKIVNRKEASLSMPL